MKSYKTLLFIVCLLLGLALLASLFPRDGLRVGDVLLEFPSLSSVLGDEEEEEVEVAEVDTLSPEELMQMRLEALQAAKDSQFMDFVENNAARFYLPEGDIAYLDPLFESLLQAKSRPVRIMYYGDSQLECDRITDVLREHLQSEFGGNGTGLLPAMQTISMTTASVQTYPELRRGMGFGAELTGGHRFGPLCQMAYVDGAATFTISAIGGKSFPHCSSFSKVSVLVSGEGYFTIGSGEDEVKLDSLADSTMTGFRIITHRLPRQVSRVTLRAHGHLEVFALMVDGNAGVSVDNIAMRGSSGTHFTSLDQGTFAPFFHQQNVRLILLEYGGNSVPYLKKGAKISSYKQQMKSQIAFLKRISPKSRIILVGPADMATTTSDGAHMMTYPQLPQVVDSLRAAALESGVAFWDMFQVMGGKGSMAKWVNARPQLAGEDYIHFTPKGARHISNILCETLDLYYKYYRFRHGLDKVELPEDTLENEEVEKPDSVPVSADRR